MAYFTPMKGDVHLEKFECCPNCMGAIRTTWNANHGAKVWLIAASRLGELLSMRKIMPIFVPFELMSEPRFAQWDRA